MDFYIVLGVERGATLNDIKRAYKRLARRYHPDVNPGDRVAAAEFRRIAEAYETLGDPDRRRRYDVHGPMPAEPEAPTFGFEGFDFSVTGDVADAPTFGDLFAEVFQQRAAAQQPERGADLHDTIELTLEESLAGGARSLTVTHQVHCRACRGAGRLAVPETGCAHCHGTGVMKSVRGHMVFSKPCPRCGGQGHHSDVPCPSCGGRQLEMRTDPLIVNVPAGLADGARLRVPSKGHAGRNGTPAGDLYITLKVLPHPVFRREGDDLHMTLPVAIHEAALGAKIEIASLDGPARLRVPPGTQSGQRLRLRGRGAASPRDGRRGDLVVEVRLALPRLLDERSKELLREFGRINGTGDVRAPMGGADEADAGAGGGS
jgi:molecular chaperone DnaJ